MIPLKVRELYKSSFITLHMYGDRFGDSVHGALIDLAWSIDCFVRCSPPDMDSLTVATSSLAVNGSFNSSYTANNQMFGYAYDAAGNLLSDGMNTMTWDAESRISTVSGATYIYDAQGDRVEKQGASVVDIVYFGGHPLARYSAGQWTDLIYGPTGLLVEVPGLQNAPPVYRATDHLGTNVGSFLANGTFTEPVDHTPFGQVFTGNTSDPYLFTGKERDSESGLDYFGARYMSSNMGRFL